MPFEIKSREQETVLVLSEDITIAHAAELHAALLPVALQDKPIAVEAGAVTAIHTSILQILLSLRQSVPSFTLRSVSVPFSSAVNRLGLNHSLSPAPPQP